MTSDPSKMPDHDVNADPEQRIRERAYQLWQADGAPDGKADEYWHRAMELLEREASNPGASRKKTGTQAGVTGDHVR
jgi:hypothetical protein